jgi:hypothetical protein
VEEHANLVLMVWALRLRLSTLTSALASQAGFIKVAGKKQSLWEQKPNMYNFTSSPVCKRAGTESLPFLLKGRINGKG